MKFQRQVVTWLQLPPRSRWEVRSFRLLRSEIGNSLPTFWDNLSVPSSSVKNPGPWRWDL